MSRASRHVAFAVVLSAASLAAYCPGEQLQADDVPAKIAAAVEPWHRIERKWADDATLIVVGKFGETEYPKVFFDGGHFRPIRDVIVDVRVLKGSLKRNEFDLNLHGFGDSSADDARVPHYLVSGRTYLVYLRPSKESQKRLNDPEFEFTLDNRVEADEIVAAVDIEQSREEAEAFATEATKSAEHNGFTFTPRRWESFRKAEMQNLRLQSQFQLFLHDVVLREHVSLKEVRTYLGAPDYYYNNADGIYYEYNVNRAERPHDGDVALEVALYFDHDMTLKKYYLRFLKFVDQGDRSYRVELDEAEYRAAGLTPIKREFAARR